MLSQGPPLITPEAVRLDLRTAGLASRLLARLVDLLVELAVLVGAGIGLALLGSGVVGATVAGILLLVLAILLLLGYPALFEAVWSGRTPGKAALGLRVLTVEGTPVRFRHAAIRAALGLVDLWMIGPAVGVIAILCTRREQRLGDLVAGTLVVRERVTGAIPSPVLFRPPPGTETLVAALDTGGLSEDEYASVRSFLIRAPGLPERLRAGLAAGLADGLAPRLPLPPAGMIDEVWLACVAAAWQRRHAWPSPPRPPGG